MHDVDVYHPVKECWRRTAEAVIFESHGNLVPCLHRLHFPFTRRIRFYQYHLSERVCPARFYLDVIRVMEKERLL